MTPVTYSIFCIIIEIVFDIADAQSSILSHQISNLLLSVHIRNAMITLFYLP